VSSERWSFHTNQDPKRSSYRNCILIRIAGRLSQCHGYARTRVVFVPRAANPHEPPGSMPAALMTAAAAGEVRNLNNVLAASGSLALVTIPAETTLIDCNSAGNGPSRSAPCTCTISLISWMPSSASPRATISALGVVAARAFRIDLAFDLPGLCQDGRALFSKWIAARSAYRRVGIDDRFGFKQRALEGIDRADVGLCSPCAYRHANADAGKNLRAPGCDLALFERAPRWWLRPTLRHPRSHPLRTRLLISAGGARINAILCSPVRWNAPASSVST